VTGNRISPARAPSGRTVAGAYQALVSAQTIEEDPAQLELVGKLDRLLVEFNQRNLASKSSSLGWLFGKKADRIDPLKGIYIWGSVGRGKSMLMDLFFEMAPQSRRKRVHFNDFMNDAQIGRASCRERV